MKYVSSLLALALLVYATLSTVRAVRIDREARECLGFAMVASIEGEPYSLHAFTTSAERNLGLSGKPALAEREGAIFVFPEDTSIGFWMKEMHFSIDIIFLDKEKKVVGLVRDARPESYPELFISPSATRYAIEVPSGTTDRRKLRVGDQISLRECIVPDAT